MCSFSDLTKRITIRAVPVCVAAGIAWKVVSFAQPPQPTLVVPIHAIKLSDNDGGRSASINPDQVRQWVEKANQIYTATGIQFRFNPDVNGPDWSTLSNTDLN